MNKILYIDTSNSEKIQLALSVGDKIFKKSQKIKRGEMSNNLLSLISQILECHSMTINQLSGICIYCGPGPYTSIRVGISTANTLSYVLNIPIFGINKDSTFPSAVIELNKKILDSKKNFKPVNAYYQQAL